MLAEGSNSDEDFFSLGLQTAGNVVELSVVLPGSSSLDAQVRLRDASGVLVADADGDASDGHFLATLDRDDVYYAEVRANTGAGLFGTYVLNAAVDDTIAPQIQHVNRLPLPLPGSDAYRDAVLAGQPSVYLRLNEASGTTAADSSGHPGGPYNGSISGAATHSQTGPFGAGGDPALGNRRRCPRLGSRRSPRRRSACHLVLVLDAGRQLCQHLDAGRLQGHDQQQPTQLCALAAQQRLSQFDTSDSSGREAYTTPSGLVGVNSWNHIAGVVDRDTGRVKLWVNGVERIDAGIRSGDILQNGNPLLLGHTLETSSSYSRFAGQIDEFALWTEARTSNQMLAPYFQSQWLGESRSSSDLLSTFSFSVNENLIARSVSHQGWTSRRSAVILTFGSVRARGPLQKPGP
jgi:hypothetical protein